MQRLFKHISGLAIALFTITFSAACSKTALNVVGAAPPYLPEQYYTCVEAKSSALVTAYFSGYGNISAAENEYNNRYYVFKNVEVTDWMLTDLSQGWIWLAGGVKCVLVDANAMKPFKARPGGAGDRIDVVGYNTGVITYKTPGLLFQSCFVLPAGELQLPAIPGGLAIGY